MVKRRAGESGVLIVVAVLLLAAMMLRIMAGGSVAAPFLRNAIHIGLLIAWGISVYNRVIQFQTRRQLMIVISLMLFWFVIRLLKYEYVENPVFLHYFWYLYYLPMLFIPLCALFTAMLLGKPEMARLPRYTGILSVISTVLFTLVMTNDFHQLVFRFSQGQLWNDADYSYGPVYYGIVIWLFLCGFLFLMILLYKCRIPQSRKFIWMPGIPMGLLLVYTLLYFLRVRWLFVFFGDMTAMFCLLYAAVLESCMQTGLIQTNTGYELLFEATTIRAQITDENWITCYQSGTSHLDAATLSKAENAPVLLNRDTLLKTHRIRGGHVAWQEDVTELSDMLERLEENQRELEDENYLEQEALNAKREVLRLQEKNRLYDLIGNYTRPQVELLDELLKKYGQIGEESDKAGIAVKICVIGAYIKRCGNLLLIRESSRMGSVVELIRAMEESMQNLELTGAECSVTCNIREQVSTSLMLEMYTLFEQVIEALMGNLTCLWVNIRWKEHALLLHMEAETTAELPDLEDRISVRTEEDVKVITACYQMGGDVL